jgi:hypothetical protein
MIMTSFPDGSVTSARIWGEEAPPVPSQLTYDKEDPKLLQKNKHESSNADGRPWAY